MSQLSKNTLLPLSLVIVLLGITYKVGNSHANIESKIEYLERADEDQEQVIDELSEQVQKLNENIIRQSEIMKRLEQKIR